MPIYEFRSATTGRVVEEIFSIRDAPKTFEKNGEKFERVPSRPGIARVMEGRAAWFRNADKQGATSVPLEAGMERDFNEARIRREKKVEENRRKVIADTLAAF